MATCTFEQDNLHFRLTVRIESATACPTFPGEEANYEVPYHLKLAVYERNPEQTGDWRALYVGTGEQSTFRDDGDEDKLIEQLNAVRSKLVREAQLQAHCLRSIREREARALACLTDVLSKTGP